MSEEKEKIKELKKLLGKRLKIARNANGYTQAKLAEDLDISDRNISNYETGYSFPSLEMLYEISKILSTSVDYLLGFSNNPIIYKDTTEEVQLTDDDYRIFDQLK